jgi:hypothetical protein
LQLKSSAAAAKRERDLTDHERNINRSSFLFLFVDAVLHACSQRRRQEVYTALFFVLNIILPLMAICLALRGKKGGEDYEKLGL